MSEFIGWRWFVFGMSLGAMIGTGLVWWQLRRELRKEEEMRK